MDPGTRAMAKGKDGNMYPVRIIENRRKPEYTGPDTDGEAWDYYVHYRNSE